MVLYKRNIKTRLALLRIFFIIIVLTGTSSFLTEHNILGCVAILLFLPFSFVSVTGLTVFQKSLEIIPGLSINDDLLKVRRFFFFGLIPVNWAISKDQANEEAKIYKRYEAKEIIYTDTLLDFLLAVFPRTSGFQGIIFKYKIINGDFRYLKVHLTDLEYETIASRFKSEHELPLPRKID